MDSPELTRVVVLLVAVMKQLLQLLPGPADAGLKSILLELDALLVRLVERSRSAVDYHETARGKAALADVAAIVEAQQEKGADPRKLELDGRRYTQKQVEKGYLGASEEPEGVTRRTVNVYGVEFLHPDHQPKKGD